MVPNLIAHASVSIQAPIAQVWEALMDPRIIKQYMVGTQVQSDWIVGHAIQWSGDYQGKKYQDKGVILKVEPLRCLQYSHYSPLSGAPDLPENYHVVTMELSTRGSETVLNLSQDKNSTEQTRDHSTRFWQSMLDTLKGLLEKNEGGLPTPSAPKG